MDESKILLIHVGFHKTGSTWLQSELFSAEKSFYSPLSKGKVGHSTLAKSFIRSQNGKLRSPYELKVDDILTEVSDYYKKVDPNGRLGYVLTHERLSGSPFNSSFDAMQICSRLHLVFPKAKILIIIRNQFDLILSLYFQYLKSGGTLSIKEFLTKRYDGRSPLFNPESYNFHAFYKMYKSTFGVKNILVLPYELLQNNPSQFIKQIFQFSMPNFEDYNKDCMNQFNFHREINKTTSELVEYKLRFLNVFIHSNSTTAYSIFSTKITRFISKTRVCNLPHFQPGVFCKGRSARTSVALGCETKNDIHAGTIQSYNFSATPPHQKKHAAAPAA